MLVLSSLNKLLSQVLAPPAIHTVVLFTSTGELISSVSTNQNHSKDDIRVLVGLGTEVWSETKEEGEGMVDSEIGRFVIYPITFSESPQSSEPLILIAINSTDAVEWGRLQLKAKALAKHLSKPMGELQGKLTPTPMQPTKSSRPSR